MKAIYKTISWRGLVLLSSGLLVAVVQDKKTLVVLLNVVNMGLYYCHEKVWEKKK